MLYCKKLLEYTCNEENVDSSTAISFREESLKNRIAFRKSFGMMLIFWSRDIKRLISPSLLHSQQITGKSWRMINKIEKKKIKENQKYQKLLKKQNYSPRTIIDRVVCYQQFICLDLV